jgi:hypothetical protein
MIEMFAGDPVEIQFFGKDKMGGSSAFVGAIRVYASKNKRRVSATSVVTEGNLVTARFASGTLPLAGQWDACIEEDVSGTGPNLLATRPFSLKERP